MKVGNLVKWWSGQENADRNPLEPPAQHGIILELSSTGHDTLMTALILLDDGDLTWISTTALELISENR